MRTQAGVVVVYVSEANARVAGWTVAKTRFRRAHASPRLKKEENSKTEHTFVMCQQREGQDTRERHTVSFSFGSAASKPSIHPSFLPSFLPSAFSFRSTAWSWWMDYVPTLVSEVNLSRIPRDTELLKTKDLFTK